MDTDQNSISKDKKFKPYLMLIAFGVLFNLYALFSDKGGAFVAIGCSMIAIGAAVRKKKKDGLRTEEKV